MYKWLNTVLCIFAVTPHAGVRIEINTVEVTASVPWSPPTRGCELKYDSGYFAFVQEVTPHAGVRIEIILAFPIDNLSGHPPRGGAN